MLEFMVKRTPLQRIGEVSDLVGMVLFMLSDEASFMTGQIVPVDGGSTVRL
jgi:3-oxoacyl-[acyl-carrier protein] reductase